MRQKVCSIRSVIVDRLLIIFYPVVPEYFCNLDANLLRLDHLQRPELNKGTIDFAVSEEYWAPHLPARISPLYQPITPAHDSGSRKPQPMDFVFALDVSSEAIRSDFTRKACESLASILFGGLLEDGSRVEPCFPPHSRLCILTFDRTIQFYDLSVRHCLSIRFIGVCLTPSFPLIYMTRISHTWKEPLCWLYLILMICLFHFSTACL